MLKKNFISLLILILLLIPICILSQNVDEQITSKVKNYVTYTLKEGSIPGLSYVILYNNHTETENLGYSDINKKELVSSKTQFELGSNSNAFIALAILNLERDSLINLDHYVSDYIKWFYMNYNESAAKISIRQLIYNTSGIPTNLISKKNQYSTYSTLEQMIKTINGATLHHYPGKCFEYSSINYEILALIVEKVTGEYFNKYLNEHIFKYLDLNNTIIGKTNTSSQISKGYKIGFFKPREYYSNVNKVNSAAGNIISNIEDIAKWLNYQIGVIPSKYDSLIIKSHQRDESVMPFNVTSYAYGWKVSLKGDGEIFHSGLNPNYSSYLAFRKKNGIGVAVLANSNSSYTKIIGQNIMKILSGENATFNSVSEGSNDKAFSVLSIIISVYLLFVFAFLAYILLGIIKRKRKYESITVKKLGNSFFMFLFLLPFLYGIYLLPMAIAGFSWEAAIIWSPVSFPILVILSSSSIAISYFAYVLTIIFPEKNEYIRNAPKIILLSILSGLANMVVILLITSSLNSTIEIKYLLYYFGLCLTVYLMGRKIVQTKMIHLTRNIIYDLRMKLINKVFSTSYEKFEKIDRGRIYTTMNDDIGTIGQSADIIVRIITSIITAGGAFIYMATLAFWASLVTILLVGVISSIYYLISRKTQFLFEDARETRSVYMFLLNGLIDGFKELSISYNKKNEYKSEVEKTTDEYRNKISFAHIKFVNAFLVGESLLIFVLAVVAFIFPRTLPNIQFYTIMSFIIILLYLIGPIHAILGAVPALMQLKIAWNRVQGFINDIPANLNLNKLQKTPLLDKTSIHSIKTHSLSYKYCDETKEDEGFSVGPINLEINKGEVLFIIGGNGSGKTSLAKLITGLYTPDEGEILIDNKKINPYEVGEYFSCVFNPNYLFKKLYYTDTCAKSELIKKYLNILQLEDKVEIVNNEFSTTDLSGGQRKRLALMQCFLEDKPIYLFDEWAADQDPSYKRFFYRNLIPEMKKAGKIIIAITHDDHYFEVADKILKMDMGKVEYVSNTYKVENVLI